MVSKLLERLMATRMMNLFIHHEQASNRQYGIRPGRSTTDAIIILREKDEQMGDKKYVLAIALDTSGAFDNVWWPNVMHELKRRSCPDNLYRLTRSYFTDRTVQIISKIEVITKPVTKGCPQGSVLGPSFWNLIFDDLLEELRRHTTECEPIAYADDIIILIAGNARTELQKVGQEAVTRVSNWCSRKKLAQSAEKTEMLLLKGKLDAERPSIIKIKEKTIRMRQTIKYLGVHLESGLKINRHIEEVTQKARNLRSSLARVAEAKWGLGQAAIRTLHKGLFEPIVTYAAAGWSDLLRSNTRIKLLRTQRMALLQVTEAYRTTSTEALQIIAGVMPIDLLIEVRARQYREKRGHTEGSNPKVIVREAIHTWKTRWETTLKGRTTYEYYSNPKVRLASRWMNPDHHMTQFISGHGDFNGKLETFQLSEVDTCDCGMVETSQHILEVCRLYDEERKKLRKSIQEKELPRPGEKSGFMSKTVYLHFHEFTRSVLLAKEKKRRAALQRSKGPLRQDRAVTRRQMEGQPTQPPRRSTRNIQEPKKNSDDSTESQRHQ